AGVVLVVAGSRSMTGAAALVADGAGRAGAGLVNVAVPRSILAVVESLFTPATFLPLDETDGGTVAESAWAAIRERLQDVDALAIGPGLTRDPSTVAFVERAVAESPVPVVIDADALNAFEGRAGELARRGSDAVLTPHAGELARLTGVPAGEAAQDRVSAARKAAAETGCTVLFKGSRTVIAEPEGRTVVNPTGGSYLATGGTGDVLTGAIAAFIAAGARPSDAAALGAYVHGLSGRLAFDELGPGVVAPDVAARLPAALRSLQEESP
ncbi:MAG TPA: NAD(P)H-hydrate dehydratase, partial [Actinomycetota bacterium]|nr:NAD(P)H-hydrate dehydratase [Actinomycetota bacterium]